MLIHSKASTAAVATPAPNFRAVCIRSTNRTWVTVRRASAMTFSFERCDRDGGFQPTMLAKRRERRQTRGRRSYDARSAGGRARKGANRRGGPSTDGARRKSPAQVHTPVVTYINAVDFAAAVLAGGSGVWVGVRCARAMQSIFGGLCPRRRDGVCVCKMCARNAIHFRRLASPPVGDGVWVCVRCARAMQSIFGGLRGRRGAACDRDTVESMRAER